MMELDVNTIAQILGFSIGFLYGEAFSEFDSKIKYASVWYRGLSPFKQWLVASFLDTQHHFQYGFVLMLLSHIVVMPQILALMLQCVGGGLVVSDWKDYEYVLERMGLKEREEI